MIMAWAVREVVCDRRHRVASAVQALGVIPFLLGDLIKVFLALLLLEGNQSTNLGRI